MGEAPSAADIIARLALQPHPEGGHFRETFRDPAVDASGRPRSTAIYFLLARGERSHWHRIDGAEVWHYYAGHALTLQIADRGSKHSVRLGPDLGTGELPQGDGARPGVAGRRKHRRLDTGRMHGDTRF